MRTSTEFFGFYQDPFKRTPDVDFYYPTKMHLEALDTLTYLIHSDEPFAVLTGEPGTGKTITIKKFINELPSNIVSAYILFPNLTPEELFMAILEDFDIHVDKTLTKNALFARLRDFLIDIGSQGKKAVIIIDEAQNLPNETLEELRLLSNLETEKDKLLKIILSGQPELDSKLNDEGLRQLKQRVTLYVKLYNIKEEDIKDYIYSHLDKAGKGHIKIQRGVIRRIAKITRGNPRLINTLMDRTIIAAFLDDSHTITEDHLRNAITSINHVIEAGRKRPNIKAKPVAIVAVIAVLAILVGYLGVDKMLQGKDEPKQVYVAENNTPVESTSNEENNQENIIPAEDNANTNTNEYADSNTGINEYAANNTVDNNANNYNQNNNAGQVLENGNMETGFNNNTAQNQVDPFMNQMQGQNQTAQNNTAQLPEVTTAAPETAAPVNPVPVSPAPAPVIETPVAQVPVEQPAPAPEVVPAPVQKDVYILANSLNVRATPSLESTRVAAAKMGQKYEYIQENTEWVQIRLSPTLTGWVFKQYVSISER